MDFAFPLSALIFSLIATRKSLGLGISAVFAVGYFSGVIRANFLGVFSTFMFDAALLGLYSGFFLGRPREATQVWSGPAGPFVLFLIAWPALLSIIPVNHLLIQLVALRSTVWFLPVLLIATKLGSRDLNVIARSLAILNLAALAGGLYVYQNGVESLYPKNSVTEIIYKSDDAGGGHHRVPSTFLSAHAYGGTMLFTLPFLFGHLFGPRAWKFDRVLAAAGIVAAMGGILMCAARQPVVMFALTLIIAWSITRFNPIVGLVAVGVIIIGVVIASTNERLQRAATLDDPEYVSARIEVSANESFLDLLLTKPMGAGMGSSVGTSIPYFLASRAPRAVGLENEYCRILVDQGWMGLGGWLVFLGWLFSRPPPLRLGMGWGLGVVLMYALTLTNWSTAFIGTGTLASIPGSVLLLTQMGILVRVREIADQSPSVGMKGAG